MTRLLTLAAILAGVLVLSGCNNGPRQQPTKPGPTTCASLGYYKRMDGLYIVTTGGRFALRNQPSVIATADEFFRCDDGFKEWIRYNGADYQTFRPWQ